jgi:membrane protease YdiL (CAAX protease family)
VALAVIPTLLVLVFVKKILKIDINPDAIPSVQFLLIGQAALATLTAILPTAIMIRATREPAVFFGWGRSRRLRQLGIGIVAGLGLMSALLATMALFGGVSWGKIDLLPADAARYGLAYALIFVLVAISEEGFLRGYGFVQLSRAVSFWPAAILTSVIFAALHLGHKNETAIGLAQVMVVGLVLAYSFRRSGGLWFACGFHAAWNFAQTFIYGVPDSGMVSPGALMRTSLHGAEWLTGGSAGPEGSLLALPALALLAILVHVAFKPAATQP